MKRILILLALFTSIVNAQTIGQYQIDNGLKSPHWINDSLNKRVRYTDSLGIYVTPKQLNDSLSKRVRYIDSLGVYVTPKQLADSVAKRVRYIDSLGIYVTPTQLYDSVLTRVKYPDSIKIYVTPTQMMDSIAAHSGTPLTTGNLVANSPLNATGGTGAVIGSGVTLTADTTILATQYYVNTHSGGGGAVSLGYLPYQTSSGFANSPFYSNGTNSSVGRTSPTYRLELDGINTDPVLVVHQPNSSTNTWMAVRSYESGGGGASGAVGLDLGIAGAANAFFTGVSASDMVIKAYTQANSANLWIGATAASLANLLLRPNGYVGFARTSATYPMEVNGIGTDPSFVVYQPNSTTNTWMAVRNFESGGIGNAGSVGLDFGISGGSNQFFNGVVAGDLVIKGYSTAATSKLWIGASQSTLANLVLQPNGYVGVMTTSSLAPVDIQNGSSANDTTVTRPVMAFQYYIGGGYRHWIRTRHNGGGTSGNAFDFYIWQPGDAVTGLGSKFVMTIGNHVGVATINPPSTFTVNGSFATAIKTVTANYTATESDNTILVNASGGAVTVTLPSPSGIAGRWYSIKKIDSSVNAVTVSGSIEGASSYTLASQYKYVRVQTDGSAWYIFGSN